METASAYQQCFKKQIKITMEFCLLCELAKTTRWYAACGSGRAAAVPRDGQPRPALLAPPRSPSFVPAGGFWRVHLSCLWALEAIQYSPGVHGSHHCQGFPAALQSLAGPARVWAFLPTPLLGSHVGPCQLPKPFMPQVSACCLLCLAARLPPHATV